MQNLLQTRLINNSLQAWLIGLAIMVVTFGLLKLIQGRAISKAEELGPDAEGARVWILGVVRETNGLFLLTVSLYMGTQALHLPDPMPLVLRHITVLVTLLQIALWGTWAIRQWAHQTFEEAREKDAAQATTIGLLRMTLLGGLWAVIILAGLANLGFNITTLIAGLGVGGIAIALAVQKILSDLFASLTIVLDKPFVVGDFIIVGEVLGTVENIGLKTTRIRSISGEQIIMPNSDLLESRVRNFKRMVERRVVMLLGVVYQTPADQLERIPQMIRQIIESRPQTRFDRGHFKEFGPHSLNIEVVFYVLSPDYPVYMDIQQGINLEIVRQFEKEGIDFAYPTQTILLEPPAPPQKSG